MNQSWSILLTHICVIQPRRIKSLYFYISSEIYLHPHELWHLITHTCSELISTWIMGCHYSHMLCCSGLPKPQLKLATGRVTRLWNMISSPAMPTVCLEQKSENFQSRNVTLLVPSPSQKYNVFEIIAILLIILQLHLHFQLNNHPIRPPKFGIRRSWTLKAKLNDGCCSNIAKTIFYISVFVSSW